MRRLLKWIFILPVVMVAGIVLARSIGEQQSLPERVAILHLTDCKLPCWIGIVPGKTTVGEARKRIREVYADLQGYDVRPHRLDDNIPTLYIFGPDQFYAEIKIIGDERISSDATVVETISLWQYNYGPFLTPLFPTILACWDFLLPLYLHLMITASFPCLFTMLLKLWWQQATSVMIPGVKMLKLDTIHL